MLSGVRGVMIGSCVDVTTLLARAFAPGKASALLSFNEGRLQPRLDRGSARRRLQAGLAYSADDAGLILKARRCSRFASRCACVVVSASLSLSMMS
jgi:hypothetical protein